MRLSVSTLPLVWLGCSLWKDTTWAFTPTVRTMVPTYSGRSSTTARAFGVDPTHLADTLHHAFTTISLSDAMDALASGAGDAVQAVADNVDASGAVVEPDNGWFGFLTGPIEGLLQLIHTGLAATGMGNAWGVSIIVLTVLIKVVTFPLTKTQLESTNKMQQMQPAIKDIQAKYQSNPEVMNQKIAEFYQTNEINPLAGCLPSLVQIPVFIGLYRAVLDLAKENKLDEGFLFLPNLEGPTYGADPASANSWLLSGW
jgi:YidC/Oxa1 family membrane protein insertase